jgi:hypothetical protein
MGALDGHSKPELSTLLEWGTFYFALTIARMALTPVEVARNMPNGFGFLGFLGGESASI